MIGAGIALVIADRLSVEQRKAVGATLALVGLVTTIPALLVSVSGGLITTRAASESNLGEDVSGQLLSNPKPVAIGAGVMFGFAMIPGLPKAAFLLLALVMGAVAYIAKIKHRQDRQQADEQAVQQKKGLASPEKIEALLKVDPLAVEVGYGLIRLVDAGQGGDFLSRVKAIRRQIATELGVVVPPIHITDNLQLNPREYSILLKGVQIARGEVHVDNMLAISSGDVREPLPGPVTTDPTFGLPSVWIKPPDKDRAQLAGYTVVDPTTVIATHLSEVIKNHVYELLGRQETKALLDHLGETHPKLVEETVPKLLALGDVQKVLQNLLKERLSIRDLTTIVESLADAATMTKDPDLLCEYVRQGLSRSICKAVQNERSEIVVFTVSSELEQSIAKGLTHTEKGMFLILDPRVIDDIVRKVHAVVQGSMARTRTVILTSANVRLHLKRLTERLMPNLIVLSHNEISPNVKVISMGMIA